MNEDVALKKLVSENLSLASPLEFSLTLNIRGSKISWEKLPWIPAILKDKSREIVIQKASQMAASTTAIIWLLWLCKTKTAPMGVAYWLPSGDDVSDFVRTKFDDFIKENEEIHDSVFEDNKDPNSVGLKKIYGVPTYWRGLKSKTKVKSISCDASVFDELNESDLGQIKQAEQRMSFSDLKLIRRLSTPTIPEWGISAAFDKSDKCYFAFRCDCSTWNILEHDFPNCFKMNKEGHYYRACKNCAKELDVSKGQWVTENKSDLRGYSITQLYSPFFSPDEIMKEYRETEFMGHFYNHVLGLPYLSATDKVNADQVLNLCAAYEMPANIQTHSVMGIDQGKILHCVILDVKKPFKVIWAGELENFEQVDHVMQRYNVKELVIDALPETRKARELMKRNPYKVWLCFYNDNQKGAYAWREDERIVSVNRTESLDVGTNAFIDGQIVLPRRSPMIELFAKHCSAIVKTVDEDRETRSKRYVYKALAADHFRHALNYAMIAHSRIKSLKPISIFR